MIRIVVFVWVAMLASGPAHVEHASARSDVRSVYALVRSSGSVWITDLSGNVVTTATVDVDATVSYPQPGLVSFVSAERIMRLDVASGETTSVRNGLERPVSAVDGQRLAYTAFFADGGDVSDAPGPRMLDGVVDVVTGQVVDLGELFANPEIVTANDFSLLIADPRYNGLVVLRLDRPFQGVVELPTADPHEVVFGQHGRSFAALTDRGELVTGDDLDVVATGVTELLGSTPLAVAARVDGAVALIEGHGVVTELPDGFDDVEVIGESGLLRVRTDGLKWFRVDLLETSIESDSYEFDLVELHRVAGMDLVAAGEGGWWFSTGDLEAPFAGSPVVGVDPRDGSVAEIEGSLSALAALVNDGASSPDARYRFALFQESGGFTGLAVSDADDGAVLNLDMLEPPLAFAPAPAEGLILSTTIQGPTITTLNSHDGNTLVSPIFEIDIDAQAPIEYRWLT